jgi:hypothetical protein
MSHNFRPPIGALGRYSQTLGKIWLSKASLGSHEERGFRDHIFRPPGFRSRPTEPILAADANGGFDRRGVADAIEPALGPRLIATAAQLGEPAGLYRVIDAGLIISGIEHTVGIVSPRRISRAGGAIAWASGADRRPEHAWFEDRGPPRTLLAFITVADHMVLVGSAVAAMHVAEGAGAPLIEKVRFAADSPLEGDGFEPSVPRETDSTFRDCPCSTIPEILLPR